MKHFFGFSVLIGLLATLFSMGLLQDYFFVPGIIPVEGGRRFDWLAPEDRVHFMQSDPRWNQLPMGGDGQSTGPGSSTLCCVAMGLRQLGINTDPASLNQYLITRGGYIKPGWIRWKSIEEFTGNQVRVTVHLFPRHTIIEENLKSGRVTLAQCSLSSKSLHWVLICGKNGDDYLILDPALEDPRPVPISKRASAIVAIRTLGLR